MTSKIAHLVIGLSALGACTVGPDYAPEPPASTIAFSAQVSDESALVALADPIEQAWWSRFGDPQLSALIERAAAHNDELAGAAARVAEARALRGQARASGLPSASADGAAGRSRQSASTAAPPGIPLEQSIYETGFNASWEIDLFGRIQRRNEAAEARVEAAIEDRRDLMLVVFAETARAYVELRSLQTQLAVAQENEAVARRTLELTELLEGQALASEFDTVRARAALQETIAAQADLQAGQRSAAARIAVLVGAPPAELMTPLLEPSDRQLETGRIPVGLPADLIARRPDVRAAERRLAAATADIGAETADLYPTFSLTGTLGLAANSVDELFDTASEAWSYASIVEWPLFDGGRQRAERDAALARREAARAAFDAALLEALRDVEDSLAVYVFAVKEHETLLAARKDRERALELAELRFTAGLDDLFAVLEAQRRLAQLETAIAAAEAATLVAAVAVYKSLGGGWAEGEALAGRPRE